RAFAQPLLVEQRRNSWLVPRKMPPLTLDLIARTGTHHFYAAVDDFLAPPSSEASPPEASEGAVAERPGTVREFFDRLEARSGVSLEHFFADHLAPGGPALPLLKLEEANVEKEPGGWLVSGVVRNVGTGQAECPVVVKAEGQERSLRLTLEGGGSANFEIRTDREPLTVLLDPERTCFRWVGRRSGAAERMVLKESE
ncbi:MAG: hypothetical protein AAF725_23710, partial [Acidobacteriota bacterium]